MRQLPGFSHLGWLWDGVRVPYRGAIQLLTFGRGLRVRVNEMDRFRLLGVYSARLTYEHDFYRAAMKRVRPGMTIIDVGAFRGVFALGFARRVGKEGSVLAIEPNPTDAEFLQKHIELNEMGDRISTDGRLMASVPGRREFACVTESDFFRGGHSTAVPATEGLEGRKSEKRRIEATTIDRLVHEKKLAPNMIKIDVEGYEFEVLRGAEQTIARYHPLFAIEIHPEALTKAGHSPEELIWWLEDRRYAGITEKGEPLPKALPGNETWRAIFHHE
ncbi:FkbM family methyltransferase [bacterium]|nr:FkbM family methyltransferase [bacterium]